MIASRAVALCVVVGASGAAVAAPLNLTLDRPDISSFFISASYNAATDTLTATGTAAAIDFDGIAPPDFNIVGGTFSLSAVIDASGNMSSGTLTIGGSVGALGATSPLLIVDLDVFGFGTMPTTQIFEFLGTATGGSLASEFQPLVGTVLNMGSGFQGSFATNFSNSGFGTADTARVVPAPGAAALLAAAGLAGITRRRRVQ